MIYFDEMLKNIMDIFNIEIYGVINSPDFSFSYLNFEKKKNQGFITSFEEQMFTNNRDFLNKKNIKSIITMAFPYYSGKNLSYNSEYKISKYAAIKDYHIVIKEYLINIIYKLKEIFPTELFYPACDSLPIFEKECARLSGIGNFGKNSLIYNDKYGSYIFLAEILSTKQFPEIIKKQELSCGSCNLCIISCPAKAITENGINSNKCISYQTQSKILDEKSSLNKWLWGCDICQNVCPRNNNIAYSTNKNFISISYFPPLSKIIYLTNKELKTLFLNTPVGWSGINLIRRNALKILNEK